MGKVCTKCRLEKEATTEFFYKSKTGKNGLMAQCIECNKKYKKEWRKKNPECDIKYRQEHKEQIKKRSKKYYQENKERIKGYRGKYKGKYKKRMKESWFKTQYGITLKERNDMIKKQDNKCLICQKEFIGTPCVDHNHSSGKIRGLLCSNCNTGIGLLYHNTKNLLRAIKYLEKDERVCENCKYVKNNLYQLASMHYVPFWVCNHPKSDGVIESPETDTCEKWEPENEVPGM